MKDGYLIDMIGFEFSASRRLPFKFGNTGTRPPPTGDSRKHRSCRVVRLLTTVIVINIV